MTEEQRTLSGYKSQVHEQGEFENPNEGKQPLDDSEEYIFRLISFPKVRTFPQLKEKKDGTRITIKVDKAICEFEEEKTKNLVNAFFRVDSLNFSEDESFESGVVRFFKKIKNPLVEGISPDWEKYFLVGMRFRCRVAIGKEDKDGKKVPNGKYFLDVPTCRPILQTDMHPEASATLNAPKTDAKPVCDQSDLANALLLAKGAKDNKEAMEKLKVANAPKDIVMALFNAELDGKVTYPI